MTNTYPVPTPEDPTPEEFAALPSALPTGPTPEPKRRRTFRSLFWPGFMASFLLLSLVSCGGVVLATGINRINLADLQGDDQAWTPPLVTATPVVTPPPADAEAPLVGETGGAFSMGQVLANITNSQVNIRAQPGYLSKPAGDVIGQVPPSGRVEIIGGRASADGLTWWLIRYTASDGATIDGWIAEATASGVQILGQ